MKSCFQLICFVIFSFVSFASSQVKISKVQYKYPAVSNAYDLTKKKSLLDQDITGEQGVKCNTPQCTYIQVELADTTITITGGIKAISDKIRDSCKSNINAPYGWNANKDCMWVDSSALTPGTGALRSTVQIGFRKCQRFVLTETETITCGPIDASAFNPQKGASDTFSFVIEPGDFSNMMSLQFRGYSQVLTSAMESQRPTNQTLLPTSAGFALSTMFEYTVKREGLNVTVTIVNDAWDPTANFVKCFTSSNAALLSLLVRPEYMYVIPPSYFQWRVPPQNDDAFDIEDVQSIQFQQTTDLTIKKKLGLVSTFTLSIYPVKTKPTLQLFRRPIPNTLAVDSSAACGQLSLTNAALPEVSEDCIRGVSAKDCLPVLAFLTSQGNVEFFDDADAVNSFAKMFRGSLGQFDKLGSKMFKNKYRYNPVPISSAGARCFVFEIANLVDYDCWEKEVVTFSPSPALLQFYEPITVGNIGFAQFTITPSPGTMQGGPNGKGLEVTEGQIRQGSVRFTLLMLGESWVGQYVADMVSQSSSSAGAQNPDGYDTYKLQLLPPERVIWSAQDSTRVVLAFAPIEDYDISVDEVISYKIVPGMIRSGLPLKSVSGNSLTVKVSEGEVYFEGLPACISEYVLQRVGWSFSIRVSGDTWKASNYQKSLPLGFSSDQTYPQSFMTVRNLMFPPVAFNLIPRRLVKVIVPAIDTYNTPKGETITFTVLADALESQRKPIGTFTMCVTPLQATAYATLYRKGVAVDSPFVEIGEDDIRGPGDDLVLEVGVYNDTFLSTFPASQIISDLYNSAISTSTLEAFGWNKHKPRIISTQTAKKSSPSAIQFTFAFDPLYDISANETISFFFKASHLDSTMDTLNTITIRIYVTPGRVTWINPFQTVSEDDIRAGDVTITFRVVGDVWSQNRSALVQSFSSDDPYRWGVNSKREELIPDVFQTFNEQLGYHEIVFNLQAEPTYDIALPETVSVSFARFVVRSKLKPRQYPTAVFTFKVTPTPGIMLLSGFKDGLIERHIRIRSDVTFYLTLFGEKFKANASQCIYDALSFPVSGGGIGFAELKEYLFPVKENIKIDEDQNVVSIHVEPNRTYNIVTKEVMTFFITSPCFLSGIPIQDASNELKFAVEVYPSGGELYSVGATTFYEDKIRVTETSITLKLDGDAWNRTFILSDAVNQLGQQLTSVFLSGFDSFSTTLAEESGFLKMKSELFFGGGNRSKITFRTEDGLPCPLTTNSCPKLVINLLPAPKYDIEDDEILSFSAVDTRIITTGIMPDPNSVKFSVIPFTQMFVAILDSQNSIWKITGIDYAAEFKKRLGSLLGVSSERVVVHNFNTTETQQLRFDFSFRHSNRTGDQKTSQLGELLLALGPQLLSDKLASVVIYSVANPNQKVTPIPAAKSSSSTLLTSSKVAEFIDTYKDTFLIVGVLAFFAIIGFVFFMYNRTYQKSLNGRLRIDNTREFVPVSRTLNSNKKDYDDSRSEEMEESFMSDQQGYPRSRSPSSSSRSSYSSSSSSTCSNEHIIDFSKSQNKRILEIARSRLREFPQSDSYRGQGYEFKMKRQIDAQYGTQIKSLPTAKSARNLRDFASRKVGLTTNLKTAANLIQGRGTVNKDHENHGHSSVLPKPPIRGSYAQARPVSTQHNKQVVTRMMEL